MANASYQLWSCDITYLPTTERGIFFYRYLVMDIFNRKIVGREVFENESAVIASTLIQKAYLREGIARNPLVLHADNGSPMKGTIMLATLQRQGITPLFSRPSVSNDNSYSEALFKTLKCHTGYQEKPFESIEQARKWVACFAHCYINIHWHSYL